MGMVLLVRAERFQTAHRVRSKRLRQQHSMAFEFVVGVLTSNSYSHSQNGPLEFAMLHYAFSRHHPSAESWQVRPCLGQCPFSLLSECGCERPWGTRFACTVASVLPVVEEWSARVQGAMIPPSCPPFPALGRLAHDQTPFALPAHIHRCRTRWPNRTLAKRNG